MTGGPAIDIFLVEDHPLFRQGLRQVLEDAPGLRVVGEAGTAAEALALLAEVPVRVLLVDLRLPDRSGIELVKELRELQPQIACLFLSAYDYPHHVQAAVEAGAAGYLLKGEPADRIVAAVRGAATGGSRWLSGGLRECLEGQSPEPLTPREREIVALLAEGKGLQAIASHLGISLRTVRNHLGNTYGKLDLHSQTEVVAWAWRTGSLGPQPP